MPVSSKTLPGEHELADRALLGREEQEALAVLAAAQHLEHAVDVALHADVAAALAARREHRLPARLDPAEVVREEERRARHRVVAVALVALHERHPAGLDDVEDARLQLGGRLGERFVDALGGLDGRLLLVPLLALGLELVAEARGADREQPGEHHARDAQNQGDDGDPAGGVHDGMLAGRTTQRPQVR